MNKYRSFNCESTSELAKRNHAKKTSEEVQADIDAYMARRDAEEKAAKESQS